ncbi:MAG: hypothetical protein AMXMBFR75_26800 [Candidatus Hinthialibacteria bacterium]
MIDVFILCTIQDGLDFISLKTLYAKLPEMVREARRAEFEGDAARFFFGKE